VLDGYIASVCSPMLHEISRYVMAFQPVPNRMRYMILYIFDFSFSRCVFAREFGSRNCIIETAFFPHPSRRMRDVASRLCKEKHTKCYTTRCRIVHRKKIILRNLEKCYLLHDHYFFVNSKKYFIYEIRSLIYRNNIN